MEENIESKYTRDINCLREKDKNIRINGLKRLMQSIPNESTVDVQLLFASKLKSSLLDLLKDPADKCKELSVSFLSTLIKSKRIIHEDIPSIISTLHSRVGSMPIAETCEEVRVAETQLLLEIMENYTQVIPPIISEVTDIFAKLGKDKCPQIKNLVSAGIIFLCTNGLRFSSSKLLEGIRLNLSHQQFKVRCATLEAVGALSLNESGIAEELHQDFKKAQVDRRTEVKIMAYNVITEILTHIAYPELKKIEGKYVYLMFGGFSDEECTGKIAEHLINIFERIRKSAEEYGEDCSNATDEC